LNICVLAFSRFLLVRGGCACPFFSISLVLVLVLGLVSSFLGVFVEIFLSLWGFVLGGGLGLGEWVGGFWWVDLVGVEGWIGD